MEITISIFSAIIAFIWVYALTDRDNIFGWWPLFVYEYFPTNRWLHKITYECEKCIAGQIALWWSILTLDKWIIINVALAIFLAMFFGRIYNRINE